MVNECNNDKVYNTVVKHKKLQLHGKSQLMILIPKTFLNSLGWTNKTAVVLEFHPYRKEIILSECSEINILIEEEIQDEEISDTPKIPN